MWSFHKLLLLLNSAEIDAIRIGEWPLQKERWTSSILHPQYFTLKRTLKDLFSKISVVFCYQVQGINNQYNKNNDTTNCLAWNTKLLYKFGRSLIQWSFVEFSAIAKVSRDESSYCINWYKGGILYFLAKMVSCWNSLTFTSKWVITLQSSKWCCGD